MSDPHAEPLRVDEIDGLHLPESFIGHSGGLVVRMPSGGTIDFKPRDWGAVVPIVRPRHFYDGDGNDHLDSDEVGLKKYGAAEQVFRVEAEDA